MIKLLLRLPDALHAALKEAAPRAHRSLNSEILFALEFYLAHWNEAQAVQLQEEQPKKKPRSK